MEVVELFDKERKPLNRKKGKYLPFEEGEYMQICHVCIFNDKNEMLIQKRSLDKVDHPGKWDISSGGGVLPNESVYDAAGRELFEELGVKYDFSDERIFFTMHYEKGFDDYFLIHMNKNINEFTYLKDEVLDIRWASLSEILLMMKNDEFIRYKNGFIELIFELSIDRGSYPRKK